MENKFLDAPPPNFDPTMEFKWIPAGSPSEPTPAVLSYRYDPAEDCNRFEKPIYVLCQKWQGAFKSCWVRVPVQIP